MNVAVLISDDAEWLAVKEILTDSELTVRQFPYGESFNLPVREFPVQFFHSGWGKISAAASTQYVIDIHAPDLLVNLGTCGGFEGHIKTGTVILVERTVVYDMLEDITDADEAVRHYASTLDLSWLAAPDPHPVSRGLIASGDRDVQPLDIPMLVEKYGALAGDWESAAIAWVAKRNEKRLLILRGVSDLVSPQGGEVYGKPGLFHERTRAIMAELLKQLPDWLACVK
jgi:adenosylhomocysteine nucleosidase